MKFYILLCFPLLANACLEGCQCKTQNVPDVGTGMAVICSGNNFIINETLDLDLLPKDTIVLTLENFKIGILQNQTFLQLVNLKELKIHNATVSDIQPAAFSGLQQLTKLSITLSDIKTFPSGIFQDLSNLETLNLAENAITNISEDILFGLENLQNLLLNDNDITNLSDSPFLGRVNLKTVDLTNNDIKTIERNSFLGLNSLTTLTLEANALEVIEDFSFENLSNLKSLRLGANGLDNSMFTNSTFLGLSQLTNLDMSRNMFVEIPSQSFHALHNLKSVILSDNLLVNIQPYAFQNLPRLEQLFLRRMLTLESIDQNAFVGLTRLTSLALEQNFKLTSLPSDVFPPESLQNLKTLFLTSNAIERFDEEMFSSLKNLKILTINGNDIVCDCNARWIKDAADGGTYPWSRAWVKRSTNTLIRPTCGTPMPLYGKDIIAMETVDLTCDPPNAEVLGDTTVEIELGQSVSLNVSMWPGFPTAVWMTPIGEAIQLDKMSTFNPNVKAAEVVTAENSVTSTLTIDAIQVTQEGAYTAIATNAGGSATVLFKVILKEEAVVQPLNLKNNLKVSKANVMELLEKSVQESRSPNSYMTVIILGCLSVVVFAIGVALFVKKRHRRRHGYQKL